MMNASQTNSIPVITGPAPEGEILGITSSVHNQADCLANAITRLESRIQAVVKPRASVESINQTSGGAMPAVTIVGGRLRTIEAILVELNERVDALIQSVDI